MIYLNHLLEATGGILRYQGQYTSFSAFSHDTRQLVPGELFVAVQGTRGDGHDHLSDAVRKRAAGILLEARRLAASSEKELALLEEANIAVVVVENTRLALQQYASFILQRWQPVVIAVTGSVGKTSTKEAIATVLAHKYATFRSWQNYNDLLGIPLSLGRLEEQHAYAVLELGADHPGEIADLCRIVRPHIGVLTNISPVQLQYFGSIEHLASELGMLLMSLPIEGLFFYNQDDAPTQTLLTRYRDTHPTGVRLYPFASTSALPDHTGAQDQQHIHVSWEGTKGIIPQPHSSGDSDTDEAHHTIQLRSHLLGKHHFATMLAAYQVGRSQGMEATEITQALAGVSPLPGRLNPLQGYAQAHLLDDTHNAAPASTIAGLTTLHALTPPKGNRIAAIGDMLNLGTYEEEAHQAIGRHAASCVDYLITRGERAAIIADAARQAGLNTSRIIITSTHEDAARAVRQLLDHSGSDDRNKELSSNGNVVLIKGSEETRMERVTELLMAHPWEAPEKLVRQTPGWKKTFFTHADRPTWVEVDLNAIGNNTRHIKAIVGPHVQVLVALKADAYGHGALKVARTVLHNGATMLGVATVSEALPLREAGITAPILVFGYIPRWQMREAVRLGITATLYTSASAQELSQAAYELGKMVNVHIKVDTGMGRLGIRAEQSDEITMLIREIKTLPKLKLEGIYTHFATADAADQTYARKQLSRFTKIIQELEKQALLPPLVHAANSAAVLQFPEAHFNMVRPGIAIYGLHPSAEVRLPDGFRAALSFKTQVSQVKTIPAGEGISYGSTYVTDRPTRIAVLPVGYADGFRRAPQNWGTVLIHGQEAPLLGRVCMDQCMVDITHIPQTRVGDEVVLIGHQGEATLTAEQIASRLGTINYEVVSEILARVPRVD